MNLKHLMIALAAVFMLTSCNNTPKAENQKEEKTVEETVKVSPPEWVKNANIYEVNLRQYTEEGTLQAFAKELPRLKEMGVDILWFMPIHPIGEKNKKGSLGSYYAVRDYKAVNPEFGTIDDFKFVVEEAHKLGMYVMLDWVANHTGWDNVWVDSNPEFYEKDENGDLISPFDWTDVIALDYSNQEMRAQMVDALKFWVEEANIDGYRCDVASEVPTDFWEETRPQLEAIKPVFMLAESEQTDLLASAFDMNYGWEFHHLMNQIVKEEKNAKDVLEYLDREKAKTPDRAMLLYFITNHDENSWNGTIKERLGEADEVMAVLTYTLGGMPLIYSGQEAANTKRLEFFEKDAIQWNDYPKADFYKTLNNMKHQYSPIWNGSNGGSFEVVNTDFENELLIFKRADESGEMISVLNLSNKEIEFGFDVTAYENLMSKGFVVTNGQAKISPWGYAIYKK